MGESKFGVYFNFSSGTFVNLTVNNLFFSDTITQVKN